MTKMTPMPNDKKLQIRAQGDRELVMERAFDAPPSLVFQAYTRPELLKRWLGVSGGWELAVCEIDLRVGGAYRWVWRNADRKKDMGVRGVYREIAAPDRLVCTEQFDDPWYQGEALSTVRFIETNGRTTLTVTMRYESSEARDGVLASPMESGVVQSYDKLGELLATMQ
jgi:uncharacterized protein YndB with AHSA1/START domain